MSLLGGKSSSNILIKKRKRAGEETNTAKIREQHNQDNRIFAPRHFGQSITRTKLISWKNLHTSHNHSSEGFVSVYEIQVTDEISLIQKGEGPHSHDRESSEVLKDHS